MSNAIQLIVVRASDLERTRRFYEALGCAFAPEQHGNGPQHYSCRREGMVFEIYPSKPGTAPDWKTAGATMIGFKVADLDRCLAQLKHEGATLLTQPKDSPYGRYVMVADPDGRAVQVSCELVFPTAGAEKS